MPKLKAQVHARRGGSVAATFWLRPRSPNRADGAIQLVAGGTCAIRRSFLFMTSSRAEPRDDLLPPRGLASRTISARSSASVAGLPGGRCGYAQRRVSSDRCQRRIVSGRTNTHPPPLKRKHPDEVRPETPDRPGGSMAGSPADGARRVRDARRVSRSRSRRLIGNATRPTRAGTETANKCMR